MYGTSPVRPDAFGLTAFERQREIFLFVNSFGLIHTRMRPKSNKNTHSMPSSVWTVILVVYRVMARMGISLVPETSVQLALQGANRLYLETHGPDSMLPDRKNPYSLEDIAALWALARGTIVAGRHFDWYAPFCVSWWVALQIMRATGFRKAEVTLVAADAEEQLTTETGVHFGLSFAYIVWHIDGALVTCPSVNSVAQLDNLAVRDSVGVKPCCCKNDQLGEIFTNLIWLPWGLEFDNVAKALVALMRTFHVTPHLRAKTFLFPADLGLTHISPYHFNKVHQSIFVIFVGEKRALSLYGHSGRIELACRMLAAGESPAVIRASLRWLSDDALKVYARLTRESSLAISRRATAQRADSVQISSLPTFDADEAMAAAGDAMSFGG